MRFKKCILKSNGKEFYYAKGKEEDWLDYARNKGYKINNIRRLKDGVVIRGKEDLYIYTDKDFELLFEPKGKK